MSDFWNRVNGIMQQQNAAAIAQQNAAISKAQNFWNRVEGIKDLNNQRNGALSQFNAATGNNPDVLPPVSLLPGNDPVNDIPTFKPTRSGAPSASSYSSGSLSPSTLDYLNADLARHYGMSRATAYQEALENTSYQRAMKDMKAAGLNPAVMFGSGRAHGAGSSAYPSYESYGGSSGGSYSRRSGGSSRSGKLFSSSAYGAIAAIGGLIGIAASKRPDGFWIGSQTAQGAMNLMNAFNNR